MCIKILVYVNILGSCLYGGSIDQWVGRYKEEIGLLKSLDNVLQLGPYVEEWQVLIWDKEYNPLIMHIPLSRNDWNYVISSLGGIAIKRVLYM